MGEAAAAGRKRRRTALSWRGGAGRGARLPEDVLRPPLLSEMNSPLAYLAIVEVGRRLGSRERERRERAMRRGEKRPTAACWVGPTRVGELVRATRAAVRDARTTFT